MGRPFLEVQGLTKHFSHRRSLVDTLLLRQSETLAAVDEVNLKIYAGEALGLVGESGCGKSTLARCIVGLYQPTDGRVLFEGQVVRSSRSITDCRRIQIVFQDPYSSLNPRMTVRQMLRELLLFHSIVPRDQVEERCRHLLELVRLSPRMLDVYPKQLSGGERQRVSIARALALEPDLLIADEPVSSLDVSVQAAVLNLLAELRDEMNLTLLFIAHNLGVVRYVCDRVVVMYMGRIVEIADTETLFVDPAHPYTQGLLAAVPSLNPAESSNSVAVVGDPPSPYDIPSGCRFHPRCPVSIPICQEQDPALLPSHDLPDHHIACHLARSDRS